MLPFLSIVEDDFEAVNQLILDQLYSDVDLVENIGQYIINSGGKRLRPVLVLLVARALGYDNKQHLDLAAIIEFIHTATLLHDDVVDISSLRRGRPTANAKWGNAPSVLVGDFLYSRSFQMMVKIGSMPIMGVLSNTTNVISEGEVQQLVNAKNPDIEEDDYFFVIHKKTAALFEAACETAAILAGADETTRHAATKYGYHLGMAFQLIDDALDYTGSAEELGKNVGDDLAEGKPTLPLIYAIANADEDDQRVVKEAIRNGDISKLDDVVSIVQATGGLKYTNDLAHQHAEKAIATIAAIPANAFTKAMSDLAEFSVSRSF